jgi:hypothetical protein
LTRTRLLRLLALTALLVAPTLALSGQASAKKKISCGRQVLNDWYDGRIDESYPAHCYRDALKLAPEDVKTYSSLEADLQRALENSVGGIVPAGQVGNPTGTKFERAVREQQLKKHNVKKDINHSDDDVLAYEAAASTLGPPGSGSSGGLPLPLIVLAAVAFLLLVAGGAGMISRRLQENRHQ